MVVAMKAGAPEWKRSDPDVVVYLPKGGEINDGDNEHFLVFESPRSGDLLAHSSARCRTVL